MAGAEAVVRRGLRLVIAGCLVFLVAMVVPDGDGSVEVAESSGTPTVTAPPAPTLSLSTSGQDPGDFVLSGFGSGDSLLVSVGFVDPPAETKFALPVTTGLTAGSGYTFGSTYTQISFTGSQADANTALAAMTVNTGSTNGTVTIRVTASVSATNVYYNPINDRFYEYVASPANTYAWQSGDDKILSAFHIAETKTLNGMTGYLATVTTAQEQKFIYENFPNIDVWMGGTDDWQVINARCAPSISTKSLTSNVATLTTSRQHAFETGDSVTVAGVDATFDGTYTISDATSSTFSYSKTASDVSSTAVTPVGTATFADQSSAEGSWLWVTGPANEKCTRFTQGATSSQLWINSSTGRSQSRSAGNVSSSRYENWCNGNGGSDFALIARNNYGEPNGTGTSSSTGEQFLLEKWSGRQCWNDWGRIDDGQKTGMLVEYGGEGSTSTAPSATVSAIVDNAPKNVTATRATPVVSGSLNVSWTAPVTGTVTSYTATSNPGGFTCTTSTTSCTISGLTNGTSYTFTVQATFSDSTTKTSTASGAAIPDDGSLPTVSTFTSADSSPSRSTSFTYTLVMSKSVTGVASGDFENAGTATGCSFSPSASSGTTLTITVSSCSSGTIIPRLKSGQITDAVGNTGPATNVNATTTITRDATAPTLTFTAPTTASTASVTFTVTGDEPLDCSTLTSADFVLTAGLSSITSVAVGASSSICTVTALSTATAGGATVTATLTASGSFSMTDTAGNAQTAMDVSTRSVSVTVPSPAAPPSPTTTSTTTTTTSTTTTSTTSTTVAPAPTTTVRRPPRTTLPRVTTTTAGVATTIAPATTTTVRAPAPATTTSVPATTTTAATIAPSTTVERRLIVEAVPTPIPGPQTVSSTTLPLSQPIAPADVQRYVQQQSQNVRDLSLPIYVSNQLPSPEPNSPLVIQTTNTQLNIVTINDQVIQLQDGDGFRLSVSATDGGGAVLPVNTNGAIVVEQNNFISVSGTGFRPSSTAVVWLFSVPNRLGTVNVGADGSFSDRVALADGIQPGEHTAQVNGITAGGAIRSLNLAVEVVEPIAAMDLADAAVLGNGDSSRAPGPRATIAQYSPQSDPETTRNLAVAATALMSLAAAGVARERREERRGKLASVVTKKLKAVKAGSEGPGDLSPTWRGVGTEQFDRSLVEAPLCVGKFSALLSRVLVDGAWLRAIFGSRATLQWTAAVALTIGWLVDTSAFVVVPATWLLCALVAMTALDALSGLIASSLIVTAALVFDRIYVAADVRALLGVAVLLISTPLLAHVIRPLRRDPESVNYARERFYDYAMMPVFVAFAAGSMAKALNGLSGLDLVSPGAVTAVKWTVWFTMLVRLAGEDVALRLYPARSLAVQPSKLVSQARSWGLISVTTRFAVYLFVAYPFFGLNANTVFAAGVVLGPALLKLWEDDLPNNEKLFFWLPRGFLRFFLLLIVGAWMGAILVGDDASADVVRSATPWLLVPGAIFGIVELFGRAGKSWRDDSVKHAGGAALWTLAVLVVSGQIQLF